MGEKKFKQVCECKNCGNEAEMTITCSLEENQMDAAPKVAPPGAGGAKAHAVCSHCGGEADIWITI